MSQNQKQAIKGFPPGRITVHNATTADIDGGKVVNLTGTETDGIPNIEETNSLSDRAFGVTYEKIKQGEKGVVICGDGEIVEVTAGGTATQGRYAGLAATKGTVANLDVSAAAAETKIRTFIGIFLESGGTGDKVKMLLLHGIHVNTAP